MRDADTVGRFGGDEFVVVLETRELGESPELVAERLLQVVRQPVQITPGQDVLISASIGVAIGGDQAADELLRNADLAMYAAKAAGKNRYVVFEDAMRTAAAYRFALELDLHGALDAGQLFLVYQPMFDLRSGRVTRLEALIRWEHPTRGPISPTEFIPVAEGNGQIVEIGRWVLDQACRRAATWQAHGFPVGVAVNVSASQLERDEFLKEVVGALRQARLDAGALTLEITETLLMRDPGAAADRLRALKRLGVRIAIDDFGTGYSSLAYLRQFPVDELKIDRSFVSGIASSTEAAALMHTLIQLGKTLGIETLGEGIEDHWQLARLRREDCDSGQGFLLARPLAADGVDVFLQQRDQTTASVGDRDPTSSVEPVAAE
jgi:predicted signal transduction protein with EAL and GGDEF domain